MESLILSHRHTQICKESTLLAKQSHCKKSSGSLRSRVTVRSTTTKLNAQHHRERRPQLTLIAASLQAQTSRRHVRVSNTTLVSVLARLRSMQAYSTIQWRATIQ